MSLRKSVLLPFLLAIPFWGLAGLALVTSALAQAGAPILAFPKPGSGGASNDYLTVSLADGRGEWVDRLERGPLDLRSRALTENLFQLIGRSLDQPARVGEIFFAPITSGDGSVRSALYVESPIGYVAYFEDPGKGTKFGEIKTLTSRPFEAIAAADANFALLPRLDTSGRTEGAYLYHGTTGKALYLDGLKKLEISPKVRPISDLPSLAGPVSAVPVYAGSEATSAYVVLDTASGEIYFFDLAAKAPSRMRAQKTEFNLYTVFSREGPYTSSRRFEMVAVNESQSLTKHVFIADAITGETAVLEHIVDSSTPAQFRQGASLKRWLSEDGSGERVFSAVPRTTSSGVTLGAWLVDSQTRRTIYIDRPGLPEEMTVTLVTIERK